MHKYLHLMFLNVLTYFLYLIVGTYFVGDDGLSSLVLPTLLVTVWHGIFQLSLHLFFDWPRIKIQVVDKSAIH